MHAAHVLLERALGLLEPGDVDEILAFLDAGPGGAPPAALVVEDVDPVVEGGDRRRD
jgi:hypothetical protein